jgi:peptide-methionine (S)-S-oxide reductase
MMTKSDRGMATFGMGCFYCPEAIFKKINGVISVVPGYSGGHIKTPSYMMVQRGVTGHAEVVQISYEPEWVRFEQLLDIFWCMHDPTTLNRQGGDYGPQYRSVIYYHSENQKHLALSTKFAQQKKIARPILTEISRFSEFYPAENKHIDYYNNHFNQPYCQLVIQPKLEDLKHKFSSLFDR